MKHPVLSSDYTFDVQLYQFFINFGIDGFNNNFTLSISTTKYVGVGLSYIQLGATPVGMI